MKLLFLTEFYPKDNNLVFTGGVEARVYYLTQIARKNFKVQIITSASKHIPATPISVISRLWYMWKSFFRALTTDFDLVEGSNVVTYLPAWLAGKLKGKPAVAWVPDILGRHWFDFGLVVGLAGIIAEKIYLKLPWTKIIALSQSTKTKLITAGVDPKKISVVKAGIDPGEFANNPGHKFKQFTIICVARLVKTKRIDQLIRAVARLNVKLIVVGFGPQEARLKRLAKGKVQFLKHLNRDELIQLLFRSHLFCLPSVVEGFGIATIEAMACGLPAVLADIPINREVTKNGQGAVFFQPENVNDLTRQLKNLKKIYKQKQREALKLARTYSWERIYRETKAVYETCLYY
ncbi:MAG: glycosyltransferase family 4 protein [Patescibacteria group bacterium]|nr:glycosyltransferase family 4 protein [Patescibacteria group bacterium]